MTEPKYQELKLYDIKYYKWKTSFSKEVYQPLQAKLRGTGFWKKLNAASNAEYNRDKDAFMKKIWEDPVFAEERRRYGNYWGTLGSDFGHLPGNPGREDELTPWAFDQDKLGSLEGFLEEALTMWRSGFKTLSHVVRAYPETGLEFGSLEVAFITSWWNVLPGLAQLVELLGLTAADTYLDPEVRAILQKDLTLFKGDYTMRWINVKIYMELYERYLKAHLNYAARYSKKPVFIYFFLAMEQGLAPLDPATLALLYVRPPLTLYRDAADYAAHRAWIEDWPKINAAASETPNQPT